MTRYYFDTFDGSHSSIDDEGVDCSSTKAVQDAAVDALPDMAREILPDGPNRVFRVDVRNGDDKIVFQASLELKSRWVEEGETTATAIRAAGSDRSGRTPTVPPAFRNS